MGREPIAQDMAIEASSRRAPHAPVGVIDIGSNSIRLVVFEAAQRNPVPLFNEKVLCAIGRGVRSKGKLDPGGVRRARRVLDRFRALSEIMGVVRLEAVATAAVRDAEDGPDFVADASARCGVKVRVLSGAEEAALAADGVVSGIPDAQGLVGDVGGGSLELTQLTPGRRGAGATLSLGPLHLMDSANGSIAKARKLVDQALKNVSWLSSCKGQTLYAVGGVWRALARIHMRHTDYALHVLQHYTIEAKDAEKMSHVLSVQSRKSLESLTEIPRRRIETLPYGALVLEKLIVSAKVARVVISAYGLREGILFRMLSEEERARDPLIEAAREMADTLGRHAGHGEELALWSAPLFPDETAEDRRLRRAACLLSDIGWRTHPDYRGEHAFHEVLRAPIAGLDHSARAFLARCVFHRYTGGDEDEKLSVNLDPIVGSERSERAFRLGLALRLGHVLSASTPGVLGRSALELSKKMLILRMAPALAPLVGEIVRKRLNALAEAFGKSPHTEFLAEAPTAPSARRSA
jgi:exopolyphosphatase/guanosine-5'-triphosphate,3'-diphosphate pyrophosphatase